MLGTLLALGGVVLSTVLFGTVACVMSLLNPGGDWVFRMSRLWSRMICATARVTVETHGAGNVPRDRPAILISNHESNFDVPAILLTVPVSLRVIAKKFLFYIPIFGWCLWLGGMIPVDRERRSSALRSLEKAAGQVRTGRPVLFFAEGTRSADGRLQPFKRGAFVIALKAGVPIVPVSVSGGHEVLPKSSLRIRPGRIVVRYGPPIPIDGYTLRTRDQLIARVHEAVRAGILENEAASPPA